MEKVENYRNYVLFHLPELKALDGAAVVSTDASNRLKMSSTYLAVIEDCLFLLSAGGSRV